MINIVTEPHGWILYRCAEEIAKAVPGVTLNGDPHAARLNYFLPHRAIRTVKGLQGIKVGFFTHPTKEELDTYVPKYNAHVCMNRRVHDELTRRGVSPVLARPGVPVQHPVIFGVCGRVYKDGRKGEHLVKRMVEAGYTVVAYGEGWPCPTFDGGDLGDFYRRIHYLVIPSTTEGGPVPLLEAIAHGVPVIAPTEVGWCDEFPAIRYKGGSWPALNEALHSLTHAPLWSEWAATHAALFSQLLGSPIMNEAPSVNRFAVAIRTTDRSPHPNYLGQTVRALNAQGVEPHIYPSQPDTGWLDAEVLLTHATLHRPSRALTPNQTGIAMATTPGDHEWLVLLEDDLTFCDDFLGSLERWLAAHARPDVVMYRLFTLYHEPTHVGSIELPLKPQNGSQAVVLRAADARAFAQWAATHYLTWRPDRRYLHVGFDKLLGTWAAQHGARTPYGLVSSPFLVDHVGVHTSFQSLRSDAPATFHPSFCKAPWSPDMTWQPGPGTTWRFGVVIRTANRAPKQNYLGTTVRRLNRQGVVPHVHATSPDIAWLDAELARLDYELHVPDRVLKPNENGLACVACVPEGYDWLIVLEDDLDFCDNFLRSTERWLTQYAQPDVVMYRLFSPYIKATRVGAEPCPLTKPRQNGSQAVVLRAADVPHLLEWGPANLDSWRPEKPSFQHVAFDKFLGAWAEARNPAVTYGLVATPFLVNHVGVQSSLGRAGVRNHESFTRLPWRQDMPWRPVAATLAQRLRQKRTSFSPQG